MPIDWSEYESAEPPGGTAVAEPPKISWDEFEPAEPPAKKKRPPLEIPLSLQQWQPPPGALTIPERERTDVGQYGVRTTAGGPPKAIAPLSEAMVEPMEMLTTPKVTTPKFTIQSDDSIPLAIGKEAVNIASSLPEFFSSPLGATLMAAGPAAPGAVGAGFTADMLHSLGQQIVKTYEDWGNMSPGQKAASLTDMAATGGFAALAAKPGITKIRSALPELKPKPIEREVPSAIRQQQAETILPDVQKQPLVRPPEVPAKEGDLGVRASAEAEEGPSPSEVLLKDRKRYDELRAQMTANTRSGKPAAEIFSANAEIQKEVEQIKNRYGGKPPPKEVPPAETFEKRMNREEDMNDWIKSAIQSKRPPTDSETAWKQYTAFERARGIEVQGKDYFKSAWESFSKPAAEPAKGPVFQKRAVIPPPPPEAVAIGKQLGLDVKAYPPPLPGKPGSWEFTDLTGKAGQESATINVKPGATLEEVRASWEAKKGQHVPAKAAPENVPPPIKDAQDLHDKISNAMSGVFESLKKEGWTFDPQWGPLELVIKPEELGGFMFMGKHPNPYSPGRFLYEYKHGMTRRYLRLDDEGVAYSYKGDAPKGSKEMYPVIPLEDAVSRSFEGLEQMGQKRTDPYNREFIEKRNAALLKAGFGVSRAAPEGTLTSIPKAAPAEPPAEPSADAPLGTRDQVAKRLVKEGLSNEDALAVIAGDKTARQAATDWIMERTKLGEMEELSPGEFDVNLEETVKRFQSILEGVDPDAPGKVPPAAPPTRKLLEPPSWYKANERKAFARIQQSIGLIQAYAPKEVEKESRARRKAIENADISMRRAAEVLGIDLPRRSTFYNPASDLENANRVLEAVRNLSGDKPSAAPTVVEPTAPAAEPQAKREVPVEAVEEPKHETLPVAEARKKLSVAQKSLQKAQGKLDAASAAREKDASKENVAAHNDARVAFSKAEGAVRIAESDVSFAKYQEQVAPFRGQPEPKPTQKITSKVLKAQKEDLLSQVDDAIKAAPEEGTEKITFDVEGDGQFTVANTKETLKSFRDLAKKTFPDTVASGKQGTATGRPRAIPKVAEPEAKDLGKIASDYVSTDKARFAITVSYADGTQIVSTDGRQLLRIVTDKAPGTPSEPVRIDEDGKVVDAADHGNYPNWKNVLDPQKEFVVSGIDTAQLAHLARQAEVFRDTTIPDRDKRGGVALKLYVNKDGSLGGSMDIGGEGFKHNLQPGAAHLGDFNPDYLWNAGVTARRLGTEKLDAYEHKGKDGPIEFQGKNHSTVVMPIKVEEKSPLRDRPEAFRRTRPQHATLPEGYGPLTDPDSYLFRGAGSGVRVSLAGGEIKIETEGEKPKYGAAEWSEDAKIPLKDYSDKGLKALLKGKGKAEQNIQSIKKAIGELKSERAGLVRDAESRKGGKAEAITEEGGAALSGPLLGIDEFLKKDVMPFLKKGVDAARSLVDIMVDVFSPASKTAPRDVDALFEGKGYKEKILTRAAAAMDASKEMFDRLPQAEQVAFVDRVKRGQRQPTPELRQVADLMRKWDDRLYVMAQRYKPGLPYLENHNRVLWKVVPGSPTARGLTVPGVRSKRPWQGSKGFLRRHVLDDMSEGLALGGVPVTYNPVEMFLLHAQDVMKFVAANRAWEALKKTGSVTWVRTGQTPPVGHVRISDNISKPYFRTPQGVLAKTGEWFVEEGAARMIENYLSRDYIRTGKFGKVGRALIALKNATTAIELGLSPFHAVFESNEVMGSSIGLGISKLASGKLSGIKDILGAPFSPKTTSALGKMGIQFAKSPTEFRRIYPDAYKWFTTKYPEARTMINDLFAGGGQPGMNEDYRVNGIKGFKRAIAEGNYPGAVVRSFPALNEIAMKPLFQTYIPRLKVGMFLREYSFELERNADRLASGSVTRPELARKTWSFIEDRFGELNFDNLYWDRTFKSAMQIMFRSVTWKLGNLRGFGKAHRDIWTDALKPLMRGEKPKVTLPVAWLAGMAMVTAVQASIISKVSTGQYPWELAKDAKDQLRNLVFPRIDPDDERQRVSIPTYWRDLVHLAHSPVGYVGSSMTGEWRRLYDDLVNRDFYRHPIYNPNDPLQKKVVASLEHLVPLPFGVSSFIGASQEGVGTQRAAAGFMGFTKAPSYISPSTQTQVRDMAIKWKTESKIPKLVREARRQTTEQFEPSDYLPLKSALKNRNYDAARTQLDKLLDDGHTIKSIGQAMRPLSKEGKPRPFTGSQLQEKYFLQSLTPQERELYNEAVRERVETYRRFREMLKQSTPQNN